MERRGSAREVDVSREELRITPRVLEGALRSMFLYHLSR